MEKQVTFHDLATHLRMLLESESYSQTTVKDMDPEFPVKIYPTRNMGEEDEKSGEEAGKFGKKYAFQKARSRLKYNLSYFGGERDGKYHPAACWKIHISL